MNATYRVISAPGTGRALWLLAAIGMLFCALLHPALAPGQPVEVRGLPDVKVRLWSLPFTGTEPAPGSLRFADLAPQMQRETGPLRIGHTRTPYLFLIQIDVPPERIGTAAMLRVLPAGFERIVFHLPDGSHARSWTTQLHNPATAGVSWPAVRVPLDRPSLEVWAYIRARGPMTANFALMAEEDWPPTLKQGSLWRGVYYGMIAVVFVMNLLQWLWTRQPPSPAYLGLLVCITLLSLFGDGLAARYLPPAGFNILKALEVVSLNLASVSAVLVSRHVLQSAKLHPRLARLWRCVAISLPGLMLLIPLGYLDLAFTLSAAALFVSGVMAALVSGRDVLRGGTATRVLVFTAYLVFVGFLMVTALAISGTLPASLYALHSWQLGSLLHLLLLHAALAQQRRSIALRT
jgi:hypothetical protein